MSTEAWQKQTGWHPDCDISPRAAAILQAAATIYAGMLASGKGDGAYSVQAEQDSEQGWALAVAERMEQECRNVGADDEDGEA